MTNLPKLYSESDKVFVSCQGKIYTTTLKNFILNMHVERDEL